MKPCAAKTDQGMGKSRSDAFSFRERGCTPDALIFSLLAPPAVLVLSVWPLLAGADDIERQLARNLRVYARAPAAESGLAPAPPEAGGEMIVYDRLGRARAPQRVALGTLPAPPVASAETLSEYPRRPRPPQPTYEIDYSLTAGYREDRLNWNIASPSGHPNVLSELKWENVNIAQISGKAEITSPEGWHFQGKLDYGWVTAGKNQDSDYGGDNRTLEFSRSNNAANAGHVLDASVGAGYRLAWRDETGRPRLTAAPLAGYSYHEQDLTALKGVQTVSNPSPFWCSRPSDTPCEGPPLGPFYGLDSRYSTQWHGPWVGLRGTALPFEWLEMFGQFEYHWTNYYAKANWNLRDDLQHPYSFKHYASGDGIMASAGFRILMGAAWALEVGANYTAMLTDRGTSTFYLSNGWRVQEPLNRVQWDSFGANMGVRYRF